MLMRRKSMEVFRQGVAVRTLPLGSISFLDAVRTVRGNLRYWRLLHVAG
jgi:hypothetical protein